MNHVNRVLLAAALLGSIGLVGQAMAAGKGGGLATAPGQVGSSPGQTFNTGRVSDPTTPPPGQLYNTNRAADPLTPPPGKTFTNPGRSK
jgi:hypothetical protein